MTSLNWRPVYNGSVAETVLGTFRTHTAGGRVTLTLNDVKIADHSFALRAKRQAERLLDAFMRRQAGEASVASLRRKAAGDGLVTQDSLPLNGVAPAPPASGGCDGLP